MSAQLYEPFNLCGKTIASNSCGALPITKIMASPHASSFICLPFDHRQRVVDAYEAYFSVCIVSALIGVLGAALFLMQIVKLGKDPYRGGAPNSQRILSLLAVSDLFADLGELREREHLAVRYC